MTLADLQARLLPSFPPSVQKDLKTAVRVLARASYLRDLSGLKEAGADTVYTGEGEVALAFVEDLLLRLGATAEQIDRERVRAHDELFRQTRGEDQPS